MHAFWLLLLLTMSLTSGIHAAEGPAGGGSAGAIDGAEGTPTEDRTDSTVYAPDTTSAAPTAATSELTDPQLALIDAVNTQCKTWAFDFLTKFIVNRTRLHKNGNLAQLGLVTNVKDSSVKVHLDSTNAIEEWLTRISKDPMLLCTPYINSTAANVEANTNAMHVFIALAHKTIQTPELNSKWADLRPLTSALLRIQAHVKAWPAEIQQIDTIMTTLTGGRLTPEQRNTAKVTLLDVLSARPDNSYLYFLLKHGNSPEGNQLIEEMKKQHLSADEARKKAIFNIVTSPLRLKHLIASDTTNSVSIIVGECAALNLNDKAIAHVIKNLFNYTESTGEKPYARFISEQCTHRGLDLDRAILGWILKKNPHDLNPGQKTFCEAQIYRFFTTDYAEIKEKAQQTVPNGYYSHPVAVIPTWCQKIADSLHADRKATHPQFKTQDILKFLIKALPLAPNAVYTHDTLALCLRDSTSTTTKGLAQQLLELIKESPNNGIDQSMLIQAITDFLTSTETTNTIDKKQKLAQWAIGYLEQPSVFQAHDLPGKIYSLTQRKTALLELITAIKSVITEADDITRVSEIEATLNSYRIPAPARYDETNTLAQMAESILSLPIADSHDGTRGGFTSPKLIPAIQNTWRMPDSIEDVTTQWLELTAEQKALMRPKVVKEIQDKLRMASPTKGLNLTALPDDLKTAPELTTEDAVRAQEAFNAYSSLSTAIKHLRAEEFFTLIHGYYTYHSAEASKQDRLVQLIIQAPPAEIEKSEISEILDFYYKSPKYSQHKRRDLSFPLDTFERCFFYKSKDRGVSIPYDESRGHLFLDFVRTNPRGASDDQKLGVLRPHIDHFIYTPLDELKKVTRKIFQGSRTTLDEKLINDLITNLDKLFSFTTQDNWMRSHHIKSLATLLTNITTSTEDTIEQKITHAIQLLTPQDLSHIYMLNNLWRLGLDDSYLDSYFKPEKPLSQEVLQELFDYIVKLAAQETILHLTLQHDQSLTSKLEWKHNRSFDVVIPKYILDNLFGLRETRDERLNEEYKKRAQSFMEYIKTNPYTKEFLNRTSKETKSLFNDAIKPVDTLATTPVDAPDSTATVHHPESRAHHPRHPQPSPADRQPQTDRSLTQPQPPVTGNTTASTPQVTNRYTPRDLITPGATGIGIAAAAAAIVRAVRGAKVTKLEKQIEALMTQRTSAHGTIAQTIDAKIAEINDTIRRIKKGHLRASIGTGVATGTLAAIVAYVMANRSTSKEH